MNDDPLTGWTITMYPADFPDKIVARKWLARDGRVVMTEACVTGDSLDEVRSQLPPGLACFPRDPSDPFVVVETWL